MSESCLVAVVDTVLLTERIVSGALSFLIILACVNVSEHSLIALLDISGIKTFWQTKYLPDTTTMRSTGAISKNG